jgi:hypothetical protein
MAKPIFIYRIFEVQVASFDSKLVLDELKRILTDYHVLVLCYFDKPNLPEIEVLNPNDKINELDVEELVKIKEKIDFRM